MSPEPCAMAETAAVQALPPEAPVAMPTQPLDRVSLVDVLVPEWARVVVPQAGRATSTA